MQNYFSTISLLFLFLFTQMLFGQQQSSSVLDKLIYEKMQNADRSKFRYIPKKPGHYTKQDWRAAIDSTWGEGMSTTKKLELFDYCWNLIDTEYPSFFHITVNWDSLKFAYRDTIVAGVSRGRFCGIMNRMISSLTDWHTEIVDIPVNQDSLKPGTPLLVPAGVASIFRKIYLGPDVYHFGASLAPLPDSTVFVYDVVANHPLGLEPGDIILGYDNIPWKQLYKELISAELPINGGVLGSNPSSVTHGLLTAAGENWHLFDTIDILKYTSGDTLHLPTSLLVGQQMQLLTSDQLPVPGVPFPDLDNGHFVSWGIVDGTQTGYIYVWSWKRNGDLPYPTINAGDEFVQALQILINDYQIDGLIIDSRFNTGGYTFEYLKPLSVLFNEDQDTFLEFVRDDPNDHYSMKRIYNNHFQVIADNYLFDRPIAMLTGPYSLSCGDLMPMQMRRHPMVRTFGLGTNGAFGRTSHPDISFISSDWFFPVTYSNLSMEDQPDQFLTHLNIPADEEIWFTQEDAVRAEDTVVKRALEWIHNLAYACDVKINSNYIRPVTDSLQISAVVKNPNDHDLTVKAFIYSDKQALLDSINLTNNTVQNDTSWKAGWVLPEERIYNLSIKTDDLIAQTSRILPNLYHFTSIGPIVFDSYRITSTDTIPNPGNYLKFEFTLHNNGQISTAKNVKSDLICLDTLAYLKTLVTLNYGDVIPNSSSVSDKKQYIKFNINCPDSVYAHFRLDISSDNLVLWSDTFSVFVTKEPEAISQEDQNLPLQFVLDQNYPNPFNPITNIKFHIPSSQFVDLSIYNILGQKVATLVNRKQKAGSYIVEWDATSFASGIYLYNLSTDKGFSKTRKLILLK